MPALIYMPPYVVKGQELGHILEVNDSLPHDSDTNTEYTPLPHPIMFYVIFSKNCTTFTLGLFGNVLLILSYYRIRTLRTTTNTFIFNMALTDVLLAFSCGLMPVLTDLSGTWPFSETTCKISQSVMEFSTFANVLTLTAISVERYQAVMYPIETHFSTRRSTMLITLLIWAVAFLCTIPKFMNAGLKKHVVKGLQGYKIVSYCAMHQDQTPLARYLSLVDVIFFYTVPLCVVVVLYSKISRHLMQVTDHSATSQRMTAAQVHMARVRLKVAKLVKVLSAVFFVGFLPHNVLILRIIFLDMTNSYWNSAASYAYCYGCVHYWLNPIALYLCNDTVKKSFNKYLTCGLYPWKTNKTAPESTDLDLKNTRKFSDGSVFLP